MTICRMSFFCAMQQAPRELEPLGGVRVVRPHLRVRERRQRDLLGRVVKEHDAGCVSPGNCVRMRCVSASATFLAGVKRSSP